jgi:Ca2+/H+ antiporter
MHLLALSFNQHRTLRLEEVAGGLAVLAGAALFHGAAAPLARRTGQLIGGFLLAASGVVFVLAVRYGVRP